LSIIDVMPYITSSKTPLAGTFRTVVLAALFLVPGVSMADELLRNPSFEFGVGPAFEDWQFTSSPKPNRHSYPVEATNGTYLLVVEPGGAAWQAVSPATEGEEWTFSGYIRNASTFQLSGENTGLLSIRFVGTSATNSIDSPLFDAERPRDVWFPWSVSGVTPPSTTSVEFWLGVTDNDPAGGGGLMFDAFDLSRIAAVPEPAPLALAALASAVCLLLRRGKRSPLR
jgi:hypothetical protein